MRNTRLLSIVTGSLAATVLTGASTAVAAHLIPIEQQRSTHAFVIVPPCGPDTTGFADQAATAFELFESMVVVDRTCAEASSSAMAVQHSQVLSDSLSADVETASVASSSIETIIHAISGSVYDVTFQLATDTRFDLVGNMTASGPGPVVLSGAMVRLRSEQGVTIFEQSVEPGERGSLARINLNESGVLAAGAYTLRATAATVIDSIIPPGGGSGDASFDFNFDLTGSDQNLIPADLNRDGVVSGLDLAALLAAWGKCPDTIGGCPADLNGDGVVNGLDLAMLLGAWG